MCSCQRGNALANAQHARTVARRILDRLVTEGREILFGMPDAGIMHFVGRLRARLGAFDYVMCQPHGRGRLHGERLFPDDRQGSHSL